MFKIVNQKNRGFSDALLAMCDTCHISVEFGNYPQCEQMQTAAKRGERKKSIEAAVALNKVTAAHYKNSKNSVLCRYDISAVCCNAS